ncbi:hypothetical protein Tco_0146581 [Tanacetum coccineum]
MDTCEESLLIELYELVCKAEDDLSVKSSLSTKRKSDQVPSAIIAESLGIKWEAALRELKRVKRERKARITVVMIAGHNQALVLTRLGLHHMCEEFAKDDE